MKYAELSRSDGKWAKEDNPRKYLTVFFSASDYQSIM